MAGLLTAAIGTLFHRPADLALKQVELQTPSLHPDMKVERDTGQAIRLLESNEAPTLKAHLHAALHWVDVAPARADALRIYSLQLDQTAADGREAMR